MGRDQAALVRRRAGGRPGRREVRQLVVGQPDRRPPELVEDLVKRIGMDRRGQAAQPSQTGPGPHRAGGAPRVGRRVIGQLMGEQDGRRGADRGSRRGGGRSRANRAPTLRQPVEGLVLAGTSGGRRQEVESAVRASFCRRVAPPPRRRAGPGPRRGARPSQQLGIEHPNRSVRRSSAASGGRRRSAQRPCAGEKSGHRRSLGHGSAPTNGPSHAGVRATHAIPCAAHRRRMRRSCDTPRNARIDRRWNAASLPAGLQPTLAGEVPPSSPSSCCRARPGSSTRSSGRASSCSSSATRPRSCPRSLPGSAGGRPSGAVRAGSALPTASGRHCDGMAPSS